MRDETFCSSSNSILLLIDCLDIKVLLQFLLDDLRVSNLFPIELNEGKKAMNRSLGQGVTILVFDLVQSKEGLNLEAVRRNVGDCAVMGELVQVDDIFLKVLLKNLKRILSLSLSLTSGRFLHLFRQQKNL